MTTNTKTDSVGQILNQDLESELSFIDITRDSVETEVRPKLVVDEDSAFIDTYEECVRRASSGDASWTAEKENYRSIVRDLYSSLVEQGEESVFDLEWHLDESATYSNRDGKQDKALRAHFGEGEYRLEEFSEWINTALESAYSQEDQKSSAEYHFARSL